MFADESNIFVYSFLNVLSEKKYVLATSINSLILVYWITASYIVDDSNKLPVDTLILEWDLHSEIWHLLSFHVTIKLLPRDVNFVVFALEKRIWQIVYNSRTQDRNTISSLSSIGSTLLYLSDSSSLSLWFCSDLIVADVLGS